MPPKTVQIAQLPLGGHQLTTQEWARIERLLDEWKADVLKAARRHPARSYRLGVAQVEAFAHLLTEVPGAAPFSMFGGTGPSAQEAEKWMRTFTLHELEDALNRYIGRIKDALLYGLRHQVNPTQVGLWLYKATQDARVNWQLIARTEMVRANAIGRLHAAKSMGFDRVWVPPHIGACRSCKELLENKVFEISTLLNASNYGRPVSEWVATIPLHPRCRHSYLPYDPDVYADAMAHYQGLEAAGLTSEERIDELFDSSGQLKRGVELSDAERAAIAWKTPSPELDYFTKAFNLESLREGDVVVKMPTSIDHVLREVSNPPLDELPDVDYQPQLDPLLFDGLRLRDDVAMALQAWWELAAGPGAGDWSRILLPAHTRVPVIEVDYDRARAARPEWRIFSDEDLHFALAATIAAHRDERELAPGLPLDARLVPLHIDRDRPVLAGAELAYGPSWDLADSTWIGGEPAGELADAAKTLGAYTWTDDRVLPLERQNPVEFRALPLELADRLIEEAELGELAKAGQSRVPKGDPRRGRIHPGEWAPAAEHDKPLPAQIRSQDALKKHLIELSRKHGGAWVAFVVFGEGKVSHYRRRSDVPAYFAERPGHRDGLAVDGKWVPWTEGQKRKAAEDPDDKGDGSRTPLRMPAGYRRAVRRTGKTDDVALLLDVVKMSPAPPANAGVEHWITVHPHGDEEKGQPVLVRNNGDGSMTVIGGAGGNLNYLRLDPSRRIKNASDAKGSKVEQHVSAAEAEQSAAERQQEVETAQANLAKASEAKKAAMADYHSFLSGVLGQDLPEDRQELAKLLKQIRTSAVRTRAYGPITKRDAGDAATRENLGLDSEDAPKPLDDTDKPTGERTPRPSMALTDEQADQILGHLDTLRGYDRIASQQRKVIGGDTKGSDALQVDWTMGGAGEKEKRLASQVEQAVRTDLARELVSWAGSEDPSRPVPHSLRFKQAVQQGGYDAVDAFSYSVLGRSVLTREAHDLLGIAGSAQLVAHAIQQRAAQAGKEGLDLKKVGEALDQLRSEQERAIVERGLARAQRSTAEAAEARMEEAKTKAGEASLYTTTMAKSLQATKLQEAGRALGSMTSGLEAASALRVALERRTGDRIKVGGFKTPSQIMQLAEKAKVPVTAANIVRVGAGNYTLSIEPEKMERLLKPQAAGNAQLREKLAGIRNASDLDRQVQQMRSGPGMSDELDANQARGKMWLLGAGSGVLGFDPGVGKTHTAIAAAMHRMETEPDAGHKALVVCPANMVRSWQRTIAKQGSHSVSAVGVHDVDPSKDQSSRKKRIEQLTSDADFTVIPYESLAAYQKNLTGQHSIVIADELQKAKDETKGAFGAVQHAVNVAPAEKRSFWGLTGTAIEKKVGDLQSMVKLSMAAKGEEVPERGEWDRKYGKLGQDEHIARSDRVRQFRQGLDEHLYRLTAAQAGNALEDPGRQTHKVALDPEHQQLLESKVASLNAQIEEAAQVRAMGGDAKGPDFGGRRSMLNALYKPPDPEQNALARQAAEIVAGLGTHDFKGMAQPDSDKAEYAKGDHAGTYAHKAVIFGTEVQPLMQVRHHLEKQGVKVFEGHGGVTNAQNDANMKAFLAHPDKAVFLTSDKNNAGVSLQFGDNNGRFQHGATHMIHFTRPENNAKIQQREARILRKGAQASFEHGGQKVPAVYHQITADTPVERQLQTLLDRERRTQDLVGNSDQKVAVAGEQESRPLAHILNDPKRKKAA